MPEVPRFLAGAMVRIFATPVRVGAVSDVAPRLRRIGFAADSLIGRPLAAHDHIEFRVDDRCFRHYSPAGFDPETGQIDVLFFLNGIGPGSAWARGLSVGDEASMLGPGAGKFRVIEDAPRHVFLGDETCIGLAEWMVACLGPVAGALEADDDCLDAAAATGLDAVPRPQPQAERGAALVDWLRANPASPTDAVYLTGHAQTIRRLRAVLKEQGLPPSRVRVDPFWADGKRGL